MSENDVKDLQTEEISQDWDIGTQDENTQTVEDLDSTSNIETERDNIFDSFGLSSSIIEDVKKSKEKKGLYYYLSLIGKILQIFFIIALILVILAFAYVRIQEDSSMVDASYLNPICFLFKNSNVSNPEGTFYCASASYTKNFYEQQLNNLEKEQSRKILSNLLNIYEKENFLKSKDVLFLLDKSKNRLQVVEVLNKFDALLKEFILPNKNKIQCRNVNIDSVNKTFEITCDAYSNSYESNSIVGFSGKKVECNNSGVSQEDECISGTSLSVANSFLNYLEKKQDNGFTLIDRQKLFEIVNVAGDSDIGRTTGYTKKTTFNIKLRINL